MLLQLKDLNWILKIWSEYELTIRTTDTRDASETELYTDETIKIKLEDVNEPPSIDDDTDDEGSINWYAYHRAVGEGLGEYTKVGKKLTCSDPD